MTEQEWLSSDDPAAMLSALQHVPETVTKPGAVIEATAYYDRTPSNRKLRLFAVACMRQPGNTRNRTNDAYIEAAERLADGIITAGQAARIHDAHHGTGVLVGDGWCLADDPRRATEMLARRGEGRGHLLRDIVGNPWRPVLIGTEDGKTYQFFLERGVPATLPYEEIYWLTPAVVSLAQATYEERGRVCPDNKAPDHMHGRIDDGTLCPDRLAVLSDALEDAGCSDESLLRHLRGEELVPQPNTGTPPLVFYRPLRGPHVRGCWAVDLLLGKE